MRAAVLHGPRDLRFDEVPTPEPGPGEVLIRVGAVGVCGSDVPRVLADGAHFYPIVLGHEFAGEVVEVAPGSDPGLVGTRAAVAPLVPCLTCEDCQRGDYALCRRYTFIGSRRAGGLAELVAVPAANLVPIADEVDDVQGALFEPSTVALHGLLVADLRGGEHVAVLGVGTVGAFAVQWARLLGARSVTAIDIDPARLELALRLGADAALDARDPDVAARALALTGGRGFRYVLETAGRNATMALSFRLVAGKGTVCYIGTEHRDVSFDRDLFEQLNRKEFVLTGSWMSYSAPFPGREWTATSAYFADGRLRVVDGMLDGTYPLADAAAQLARFGVPGDVSGKVIFLPGAAPGTVPDDAEVAR